MEHERKIYSGKIKVMYLHKLWLKYLNDQYLIRSSILMTCVWEGSKMFLRVIKNKTEMKLSTGF